MVEFWLHLKVHRQQQQHNETRWQQWSRTAELCRPVESQCCSRHMEGRVFIDRAPPPHFYNLSLSKEGFASSCFTSDPPNSPLLLWNLSARKVRQMFLNTTKQFTLIQLENEIRIEVKGVNIKKHRAELTPHQDQHRKTLQRDFWQTSHRPSSEGSVVVTVMSREQRKTLKIPELASHPQMFHKQTWTNLLPKCMKHVAM